MARILAEFCELRASLGNVRDRVVSRTRGNPPAPCAVSRISWRGHILVCRKYWLTGLESNTQSWSSNESESRNSYGYDHLSRNYLEVSVENILGRSVYLSNEHLQTFEVRYQSFFSWCPIASNRTCQSHCNGRRLICTLHLLKRWSDQWLQLRKCTKWDTRWVISARSPPPPSSSPPTTLARGSTMERGERTRSWQIFPGRESPLGVTEGGGGEEGSLMSGSVPNKLYSLCLPFLSCCLLLYIGRRRRLCFIVWNVINSSNLEFPFIESKIIQLDNVPWYVNHTDNKCDEGYLVG